MTAAQNERPSNRTPTGAETGRSGRQRGLRVAVAAALAAIFALAVGLVVGPQHVTPTAESAGDAGLAQELRDAPGGLDGFRSIVAARIDASTAGASDDEAGMTWASIGTAGSGRSGGPVELDTVFELGSITKTFTGALFADAIERGEVAPDDVLADHLSSLDGTEAGGVTLASLAQHTSGLPRLGTTAMLSGLTMGLLNENPYASTTTQTLIDDAAQATLAMPGEAAYSNFGMSLLGTALAETAPGVDDYASLLRERITEPLGMTSTTVAASAADVPADAVPGFHINGTPAPRWSGEGYLPAGSATFTSIGDLATWAMANLDGTAPGAAALDPTAEFAPGFGIGWAWLTTEDSKESGTSADSDAAADVTPGADDSGASTWHNGATAGFTSIIELDREAGTAWVAIGNTATPVETIGAAIETGAPVPPQPALTVALAWSMVALAFVVGLGAAALAVWLRSMLPALTTVVWAVGGLLLAWHSGPWFQVGGWAWGIALAPSIAAVAIAVARRGQVRFAPGSFAWLWWVSGGLAALSALLTIFLW
ncbi:MAG: serine hydrolase domain-containing protein [Pseudoclavibacter sp.]